MKQLDLITYFPDYIDDQELQQVSIRLDDIAYRELQHLIEVSVDESVNHAIRNVMEGTVR